MAYKPGESGNKEGRPVEVVAFKRLCRNAVDADVLKAWINEVHTLGPQWVKCSEYLASYGYGKPSQEVTVAGDVNVVLSEVADRVNQLTDEQLIALIKKDKEEK